MNIKMNKSAQSSIYYVQKFELAETARNGINGRYKEEAAFLPARRKW
jgi:hypothetical protein